MKTDFDRFAPPGSCPPRSREDAGLVGREPAPLPAPSRERRSASDVPGVGGEKAVRLAAKLYEARDYIQLMLTPAEYRKRIEEYQGYIRRGMTKWNIGALDAAMKLVAKIQMEAWQTPIVQACLFAAYVEMVEPSGGGGAEPVSETIATKPVMADGVASEERASGAGNERG